MQKLPGQLKEGQDIDVRRAVGPIALGFILVGFVVLAWAYGLVLPPFENLDEIEHFSAIRFFAETGSLPVHDEALQREYHYRQEASQPPLYYILMGGLVRLLNLPTEDTNSYLLSNPFVACGPSDIPYNRHTLYHNPAREAFSLDSPGALPWEGALGTLHFLRVLAPFLQLVTILGVYAIVRLIFPQHIWVAVLAAALTAFNPQFLLVSSGVNNDNLVTPLAVLGVYLALMTFRRGPSLGRSLAIGVIVGLAGLSKLSGFLLLALVGFILLVYAWRSGRWRSAIGNGLLVGVVAGLVSGWWFWRNWQLYSDLTALEPMLKLVGRRESSVFPLLESDLMFRSFWGQISCAFYSDRFYLFFALLTGAGLVGLAIGAYRSWREDWQDRQAWIGMLWLTLWLGIIFMMWVRWDLLTPAPGGRLLFPAIVSTSTLLAFGLLCLWSGAWRGRAAVLLVVLLAGAAVATLVWELQPLFALPRTYAAVDDLEISRLLGADFGSNVSGETAQVKLLGYDAEIEGDDPYLDATFYWQAPAPVARDYALAIQLTSPVPGDDSLRFNYNTWPGRGNYPSSAWPAGRVIADRYRFKLPDSDAPTQAWQLLVALYEVSNGDRLSVRLNDQDVGKGLVLTTLRVPGHPSPCSEEAALDEPAYFGPQDENLIALTGMLVKPNPGSADPKLDVSLCWNGLAPTSVDYTVFVHLYDENGELLATGDGPPMDGAFPTRLWQPGDVVHDLHTLSAGDSDIVAGDDFRVGVGLYDLNNGERLQAVQAGQALQDNVVLASAQW
jgi:hypothetical protein